MRKLLSAAVLMLGLATTMASAQVTPPESSVIVTQGVATLNRPPDRAWVSIAVDARQGKAADARREAATLMTMVQAAVKAVGIPADAIKTTGYSLQPQMEWDGTKSRIRDYVAHNQIEVLIDNIDQVSDVIDAASTVKTTLILTVSISGVRFDLKSPDKTEQEALGVAVKDALARAQAIAAGLGRPLGPVVRVEDQRITRQPRPVLFATASQNEMRSAQVQSTPIAPNEIEIRASVSVTVRIQ